MLTLFCYLFSGVHPVLKVYTNMSCTANGTDVHTSCTYERKQCKSPTHNYASVMCYASDVKQGIL